MKNKILALVVVFLFMTLACGSQTEAESVVTESKDNTVEIATSVAATLAAIQPTEQMDTPQQATGTIAGKMCFPSEGIPPMTAFFENTVTHEAFELEISQNQIDYSIDVPTGEYYAYAWLPGFSFGGSYSQSVPCGLSVECNDHSLIPVTVLAGQITPNVDICDWYSLEDVPFPPNYSGMKPGAITGTLSYPSEGIPPLQVVAFEAGTDKWYSVITLANAPSYTISNLPPSTYYIVAYPENQQLAGGYSQAVPCGLSVDCTDHSLIPVVVGAGETVSGIDPGDWYAPPNTFPSNPLAP